MIYHMAAFALGCLLDLIFADPIHFPHPVRLMGKLISVLERKWNTKDEKKALSRGVWMVITVILVTVLCYGAILAAAYLIYPWAGAAAEAVMTWQLLAARSLDKEASKVYRALKKGDTEEARLAVSMIVGRDTEMLDRAGITKAACETVAENTSDGVIAPMLFTAIGGPLLGAVYKAVNTMDSMTGYKNSRFLYFGRAAARLDDIVNFIPARLSALLMILSCAFLGKDFDIKGAAGIYRRDRRKHASPNSAHPESVCAGALGVQLAGNAYYFGELKEKPFIGDHIRDIEPYDIRRTIKLMYSAAAIFLVVSMGLMLGIWFLFR